MDLANFHQIVPVFTPLCSAQDITNVRKKHQETNIGHTGIETYEENDNISQMTRRFLKNDLIYNGATGNSNIEAVKSNMKPAVCKDAITTVSRAYQKARRSRRSVSLVENCMNTSLSQALWENPSEFHKEKQRRCSLGDLIRVSQGVHHVSSDGSLPLHISDALNMYRHRRSITDTYLGDETHEDAEGSKDSCSSQAILTILSHVSSSEEHVDVRDVFKKRRTSAAQLYFSPETGDSEDETLTLEKPM